MRTVIKHNIPDIRKAIKGLAARPEKIDGLLEKYAAKMARSAREKAAKNTSQLAKSIRSGKVSDLHHEIVAASNYARAVEEGTGPGGFPPVQSLIDWINTAGITPDDPFMEVEDLAFVIARSIYQRGTPAQPFMEPAVEEHTTQLNVALRHAITHSWKA